MDIHYPCCCGIDVHQRSLTACVLTPGAGPEPGKEVRTFSTMTADLVALADWLAEQGVTHVAMESTGVYWKPVWNLLEDRFTLLLVNAAHIKAVPGRKTDVADAEWIADLLRHGLLQPSFVPDREQRELRELTRYRTSLVRMRSAEVNRLHKTLEGANIKLGSVASDLTGVSARQMLEQLAAGNEDTAAMAELAKGRMRTKTAQLEQALHGRMAAHQRFMVTQHLVAIDNLDAQIATVETEIDARMAPFAAELALLQSMPGIGPRLAQVLVAEIGIDMSRFRTAAHLASWAGMCPGHDESAGKRRSGRTRKGNPWLRTALVEAAHAAGRTNDTYPAARYHRLIVRRGKKKAAVAVGRLILEIAYHLLSTGEFYQDERIRSLPQGDPLREQRHWVRKLEQMGHQVTLTPAA
jgi:transposase